MSALILLVEDNPHYTEINREMLIMSGYRVVDAQTISGAKALFEKEKPDLIVLDIMLPDGNGLELCEEIRRTDKNVPILFLSALGQPKEVVAGFKAGGDDYLPKPYDLDVLLMRVEAVLHRKKEVPDILEKGLLTIDLLSNEAVYNGRDLHIKTGREFDVLFFLAKNENEMFSSEQIYERIWKQPMLGSDASVRNIISALRKKLEDTSYTITTDYGKGHVFEKG